MIYWLVRNNASAGSSVLDSPPRVQFPLNYFDQPLKQYYTLTNGAGHTTYQEALGVFFSLSSASSELRLAHSLRARKLYTTTTLTQNSDTKTVSKRRRRYAVCGMRYVRRRRRVYEVIVDRSGRGKQGNQSTKSKTSNDFLANKSLGIIVKAIVEFEGSQLTVQQLHIASGTPVGFVEERFK